MTPAALDIKKPNGSEALTVQPTPMELLHIAVANNLDIDKLAKLMELQKQWKLDQAREAFVKAINAFKANPPAITKNRHVSFGETHYDHATLDQVCAVVNRDLSKYGLSHRWAIDDGGEMIAVTCVLTHELGHSEQTTMRGPADNSGKKNPIQARASTVTYLQRYTLLAAVGLAAGGTDNDGIGAGFEQLDERLEWIANCRNLDELKQVYSQAITDAKVVRDADAIKAIIAAKDKRKAQLEGR